MTENLHHVHNSLQDTFQPKYFMRQKIYMMVAWCQSAEQINSKKCHMADILWIY